LLFLKLPLLLNTAGVVLFALQALQGNRMSQASSALQKCHFGFARVSWRSAPFVNELR
jgi:hypothetical protein